MDNIFDMLGIEVPVQEKKPENKKTTAKKGKTSAKKSGGTEKQICKLPVTVVTGYHNPVMIEGSGNIGLKDLKERIHKQFAEYATGNMTVRICPEKSMAYVGFKQSTVLAKGARKLDPSMECRLGSERLDVSGAFDGSEEQEIDVLSISQVLEKACPIFKGCSIVTGGEVLVPVFTQTSFTDQKLAFPVNVLLFGRGTKQITKQQYADKFTASGMEWDEEDGTVQVNALMDLVIEEWPDLDPRFTILRYDKDQNMILVTQQVGEEEKKSSDSTEKTYPTEGTTVSVIFQKLPLSPDLFGGKTKVGKQELQTYVAGIFPEYSGNNVDLVYNKDTNLIVPVLRGSTKGALDVVLSEQECLKRVEAQAVPFCCISEDVPYRVQSTPVMITACSMNGDGEGWHEMRVPAIPQYVLAGIYKFFKQVAQVHETEVRVQVYYDSEKGEYMVYLPEQEVTAASVFTKEAEYSVMTDKIWPVLDIHSHCRFPAMWSAIDNANELGNWIFGVIGSIGREPQMKLRVGTGGYFMELEPDDVFEFSAVDEGKTEAIFESLCRVVAEKLTLAERQ